MPAPVVDQQPVAPYLVLSGLNAAIKNKEVKGELTLTLKDEQSTVFLSSRNTKRVVSILKLF